MIPALPDDIADTVRRALAEDVGSGDLTAALLPEDGRAAAVVISRERAVLCGCAWFAEVFRQLDSRIEILWRARDGDEVSPDQALCDVRGPTPAMLTGERTALNFLQTLSGVATTARRYARAVEGLATKVLDTRKTLPGLRSAQKFAVVVGGCRNHRRGLYDGLLIKENHICALGSIRAAVGAARSRWPGVPLEVEVENLEQLGEAVESGADIVLLDNLELAALRQAVAINQARAKLEASGSVRLEDLRAIAETGVDYVSVGALTKHVRAVDLSMRLVPGDRAHQEPTAPHTPA